MLLLKTSECLCVVKQALLFYFTICVQPEELLILLSVLNFLPNSPNFNNRRTDGFLETLL